VYEYPRADGDPYYPIPRPENTVLYGKYQALAEHTPRVHFVGRLATYKYYNMDQVTAQALALFDRLAGTEGAPLGRPAHGASRRPKSLRPVKAKLVTVDRLVQNDALGIAAAPQAGTGIVGSE
jgi:UDP-galactopyranose mutase